MKLKKLKFKKNDSFGIWTLQNQIGSGGNGIVWKAVSDDGRLGAIKFLHPRHFDNKKRYKRFVHEVQALESCRDLKGILPLWDSNLPESPTIENPPWFVSPLAIRLREVLGSNPLLKEVVTACSQYADTLAQLHARDISHRDIKPDNLFQYEGEWVIGDFGLVDFPDKTAVTTEGEILGPMHYFPPEMITSAETADGKAADVYLLAKTFWVLATHQNYPLPGPHRYDDQAYQLGSYSVEQKTEKLDKLIASATTIDPSTRCSMPDFSKGLALWLNPIALNTSFSNDFSNLRPIVDDLTQPEKDRKAQQDAILQQYGHESKRIIEIFKTHFHKIGDQLRSGGFPVAFHSPGSLQIKWFDLCFDHPVRKNDNLRVNLFGAQASIKNDGKQQSL